MGNCLHCTVGMDNKWMDRTWCLIIQEKFEFIYFVYGDFLIIFIHAIKWPHTRKKTLLIFTSLFISLKMRVTPYSYTIGMTYWLSIYLLSMTVRQFVFSQNVSMFTFAIINERLHSKKTHSCETHESINKGWWWRLTKKKKKSQ